MDVLLCEQGLAESRTKAQALILAGRVKVNEQPVLKVGTPVFPSDAIELISGPKFVSRGGEKLEGALHDFGVSPEGLTCLDVGSSTGGFTDCLLQKGATLVFAVDVGKGQLDVSLRENPKVQVFEETHILNLSQAQLNPLPTFGTIDVSFISLEKVLGPVKALMKAPAVVLAMIKPQFEVGPKFLKKGVVRSEEIQLKAVNKIIDVAKKEGFEYIAQSRSRLKGPKGNQEYFIHLKLNS